MFILELKIQNYKRIVEASRYLSKKILKYVYQKLKYLALYTRQPSSSNINNQNNSIQQRAITHTPTDCTSYKFHCSFALGRQYVTSFESLTHTNNNNTSQNTHTMSRQCSAFVNDAREGDTWMQNGKTNEKQPALSVLQVRISGFRCNSLQFHCERFCFSLLCLELSFLVCVVFVCVYVFGF